MIPVITYLVYFTISLSVTIWVAASLHRNGRAFLIDAFHGNESLADSVNHLLVVGFYLINVGYVTFVLKMTSHPEELVTAIEMLSAKLGLVLLVLGGMHFFNIYLFSRFRSEALLEEQNPPAQASGSVHCSQ